MCCIQILQEYFNFISFFTKEIWYESNNDNHTNHYDDPNTEETEGLVPNSVCITVNKNKKFEDDFEFVD